MPKVCPVGYFCIDQVTLIGILFLTILIIVYIFRDSYNKLYSIKLQQEAKEQSQSQNQSQHRSNINNHHMMHHEIIHHEMMPHNMRGHTRVNNDLIPPGRDYYKGLPINIETRGDSGDFQQLGILTKNSISDDTQIPGNNTESNILPLYGKRLYRGSSKYYYYTETDKYKSIKVPLMINGKDCTDDQGCDEINDGDNVVIPAYNGTFVVKLYKFNKPRYIPF